MKYSGSCHCGKVAFEVEGTACNCSICSRKGSLMWFVPRASFHLLMAEDKLATYTFNKHTIKHRFCATCGIHTFGEGATPKGEEMVAINIRCLDNIDLDTLPVKHFDGRSL